MRGYNINIYFSEKVYSKIKPLVEKRKISSFVNQAVEKELENQQNQQKKQLRQQLTKGYQAQAKNKKLREESLAWEKSQFTDLGNE
jgi:hypothetical protein